MYAVLGRAEPALWHARRCLVICEAAGIGDYGIAAAYEGMARAELLAENLEAARSWKAKGLAVCADIAQEHDRKPIRKDLDALDV